MEGGGEGETDVTDSVPERRRLKACMYQDNLVLIKTKWNVL